MENRMYQKKAVELWSALARSILTLIQWRSQPDNLVPLCKFQIIIAIHFFRNWLFSQLMKTKILHSETKLSGWLCYCSVHRNNSFTVGKIRHSASKCCILVNFFKLHAKKITSLSRWYVVVRAPAPTSFKQWSLPLQEDTLGIRHDLWWKPYSTEKFF